MHINTLLFRLYFLISIAITSGLVGAQPDPNLYPNKPIRLIVPFEAGGTSDTTARMMAQKLEKQLNTQFVIENKPGANGVIASTMVSKAQPDGYTLMHTTPAFIINPFLNKNLSYDVFKDFIPITNIGLGTGYVMVINSNLPAKNIQEFITYGKNKANGLSYASPGIGNALHLASAQFSERVGINTLHIPYKGTSPALMAVITGDADFMIMPPTIVHQYVSSGKVRAIAFTGSSRSSDFPDIPTFQESGIKDLVIAGTWLGWFAPAGTSPFIIDRIAKGIKTVLQDPEMVKFLSTSGFRPDGASPSDFDKFVRSESKRIEDVLKNVSLNN